MYTALATYLDRVFPDVNGVRRPWLFFLYPSYWTGGSGGLTGGNACCSCTSRGADLPPHSGPEDEDVVAERELVSLAKPFFFSFFFVLWVSRSEI